MVKQSVLANMKIKPNATNKNTIILLCKYSK